MNVYEQKQALRRARLEARANAAIYSANEIVKSMGLGPQPYDD